jgi:ribosomal-protein-alanine acetyltransferase
MSERSERINTNSAPMSNSVELVPMVPAHVEQLMAYERDMFGTEAWTRGSYLTELADTRGRYYLAAFDDGALVGWAGVLVVADTAEILTVGVVPAARGRGIARMLVGALRDEARRRGAREAFLEVRVDNAAARQLYASEGYAEIDTRPGYYDAGRVDAVVMHREL